MCLLCDSHSSALANAIDVASMCSLLSYLACQFSGDNVKSCLIYFLKHYLTFGNHPLDSQLHVSELNKLSNEVILVPAGCSSRAGPG